MATASNVWVFDKLGVWNILTPPARLLETAPSLRCIVQLAGEARVSDMIAQARAQRLQPMLGSRRCERAR